MMMTETWMALSAAVDAGAILGEAGMTILIGLTVVFAVLIFLTLIFWLFGKAMSGGRKEKPAQPPAAAQKPVVTAAPAPIPAGTSSVQEGISDEVVAVIAAAVSAMAPAGKRYAVRSVSRVRGERPAWGAAGVAENTRPF